jgi:isoleucyl-tRNA synthetase
MSTATYPTLTQLQLPIIEVAILKYWQAHNIFQESITQRNGMPTFVFYEGPPSANGMPGIHHVISRAVKDMFCRYKTMQGFQVMRKAGWDTHGLPVELGVEKELGITKEDIGKSISVADYNQKCREVVMRYQDLWSDITTKMGYWVNLDDPYITYKNEYIETLWWCLKELHTKNLLYKSVSIQPYSPAAGTGLSSHELNQPGTYKDVKDTSATVLFNLNNNAASAFLFAASNNQPVYVMAWTTTPWTLPSNLGLTVGDNITYALIETFNPYTFIPQHVILAEALIGKYFRAEGHNADFEIYKQEHKTLPYRILKTFTGKEIVGCTYDQLMPFESNAIDKIEGEPFKIVSADFVTTSDGTGVVHTAPAFGADDYKVGQKNNLGILVLVDRQGKFIAGTGEYSGRYVKNYRDEKDYVDVNIDICIALKKDSKTFKVEKYEHSYPHCWRTDKPIIYYPLDAWFIRTTAMKDKMVELNKTINWKPKSTGEGRFGNWLENMVDWNLSRSRYWGTPLPVWRTADGQQEKCIGSIAELKAEIEKSIAAGFLKAADFENMDATLDLHKPFVDDIILCSTDGQQMMREPDLIDVWFDSGAMPYAQHGIAFAEKLKAGDADAWAQFPADFIAEGVDQTRGWFYTLHTLGVMLFDNVAYKAVISNGLVLDKEGQKMSKRLGNVVDPFVTINKYSADATRWYLVTNANPWDSVKFDENGIVEVQRKFFGTLYNTYAFFALYANVDQFRFTENDIALAERPEIDRWIISKLNSLTALVTESLEDYEPTRAARAIQDFVDAHLSNWHVRLSRKRFWRGEYEQDKIAAYQTLCECLTTISKLMAPIAPFFSDWLFQAINSITKKETATSVHLTLFPKVNAAAIDANLEEQMQLAQDTCSLILSLRKKEKLKVRQPLQKVMIPVLSAHIKTQFEAVANLIKTETNIKEIVYLSAEENIISKKIKANFKQLGTRLGANMKAVAAEINTWQAADINEIEQNKQKVVVVNGESIAIHLEDVDITASDIEGWSVASKDGLTVALDITLSPELVAEGLAREFVNKIQSIRKDCGLEVTDRIDILLATDTDATIIKALNINNTYVCSEVLANSITTIANPNDGVIVEINEYEVKLIVKKVEN